MVLKTFICSRRHTATISPFLLLAVVLSLLSLLSSMATAIQMEHQVPQMMQQQQQQQLHGQGGLAASAGGKPSQVKGEPNPHMWEGLTLDEPYTEQLLRIGMNLTGFAVKPQLYANFTKGATLNKLYNDTCSLSTMMERIMLTIKEPQDSPYHIRALYKVGSYKELMPESTGQMAGGCFIVRVRKDSTKPKSHMEIGKGKDIELASETDYGVIVLMHAFHSLATMDVKEAKGKKDLISKLMHLRGQAKHAHAHGNVAAGHGAMPPAIAAH
ncbi:hypothetical protein FA10DRAFT_134276 [Acaromyces ingoldii]|uniref:Uncharacterized protein n=1 Tax=Acaromyces ingoldii TaxID=215250 RepID=A0A316YLQ8_9BASI|nr:hypothetical protein FA10DRAFT_134276 [Acaromyces ingoldii]PWN89003.1 hypothetical protein FA10DRAFT_134276 [Acaromyces ingoldii]